MTLSIKQNINNLQAFKGISSLNAAYINNAASRPAQVQNSSVQSSPAQNAVSKTQIQSPLQTTQGYAPELKQTQTISKPASAYIEGVGAVPSGYFIEGESNHGSEDHIIKKTPLTGARITADKITKSIFSYAPKGMRGSKNSNFYEYLSIGMIPYIAGSVMMVATTVAASKFFNPSDAKASKMIGKSAALGVVFCAVMKWLGGKVMEKGTEALTGVDMAMPYKKVISELPENGKEKTSTEFHRVFESVDFPRWDLINKQGEEEGNRYQYYDNIAKKKLGCDEPLNAPDQVVQPLITKALTKAMAAKSISSFLWAATGVALAAQKDFANFATFSKKPTLKQFITKVPVDFARTLKDASKSLWNGTSVKSKIVGRGLIIGAAASTVLGLLNVKRGYKIDKKPSESQIDYKKDYVEN